MKNFLLKLIKKKKYEKAITYLAKSSQDGKLNFNDDILDRISNIINYNSDIVIGNMVQNETDNIFVYNLILGKNILYGFFMPSHNIGVFSLEDRYIEFSLNLN